MPRTARSTLSLFLSFFFFAEHGLNNEDKNARRKASAQAYLHSLFMACSSCGLVHSSCVLRVISFTVTIIGRALYGTFFKIRKPPSKHFRGRTYLSGHNPGHILNDCYFFFLCLCIFILFMHHHHVLCSLKPPKASKQLFFCNQ